MTRRYCRIYKKKHNKHNKQLTLRLCVLAPLRKKRLFEREGAKFFFPPMCLCGLKKMWLIKSEAHKCPMRLCGSKKSYVVSKEYVLPAQIR
jgi:hypothetical protein